MKFGRPGASGSRDATMGPRINIVLDFENIGHRDIVSLTVTKSVKNHSHGRVGGPGAWGLGLVEVEIRRSARNLNIMLNYENRGHRDFNYHYLHSYCNL